MGVDRNFFRGEKYLGCKIWNWWHRD